MDIKLEPIEYEVTITEVEEEEEEIDEPPVDFQEATGSLSSNEGTQIETQNEEEEDNIDNGEIPLKHEEVFIKDEYITYNFDDDQDFLLCPHCDYQTTFKNDYNTHLAEHNTETSSPTDKEKYICNVCEYKFQQKCHLNRHIRTVHFNEKPYCCVYCTFRTAERRSLRHHMVSHGERSSSDGKGNERVEKCFKCTLCEYETARSGNYIRHMKIHNNEKSFACTTCNYKCFDNYSLKLHMAKHNGEKPFMCKVCNFKSVQKSDLRKHIMLHTGEKPYKCDMCNYRAVRKFHIQMHMKVHNKSTKKKTKRGKQSLNDVDSNC